MQIQNVSFNSSLQNGHLPKVQKQPAFKSATLIIEEGFREFIQSDISRICSNSSPKALKKIFGKNSSADIDAAKICEKLEQVFPELTKKVHGGVFKLAAEPPFALDAEDKHKLITEGPSLFLLLSKLSVSYQKGNVSYHSLDKFVPSDFLPTKGSYKQVVNKIVKSIEALYGRNL